MKAGYFTSFLTRSLWLVPALMAVCASAANNGRPDPLVGKPAPAFQVQGIYNETCSLESFKGHVLVMQFGSSW